MPKVHTTWFVQFKFCSGAVRKDLNDNNIIILTEYFAISAQLLKSNKFTNLEQTPLNGSQQLPAPYKQLIDGIKQN